MAQVFYFVWLVRNARVLREFVRPGAVEISPPENAGVHEPALADPRSGHHKEKRGLPVSTVSPEH